MKTRRSRRQIAITSDLAAALREYRVASVASGDHDLVFHRQDGRPYSHGAADRALQTAVRNAKLDPAPSWHDLRHTHVSRLLAAGRDPVSVAARIGDSVQTLLSTYAHEFDTARRRAQESNELASMYDRGSAMEASDASTARQAAASGDAEVADLQARRDAAQ